MGPKRPKNNMGPVGPMGPVGSEGVPWYGWRKKISNAVIKIRQSKLPDPIKLGNGGSFFKNPVIDKKTFNNILFAFPNIKHYILSEGNIKLAAGWMIDKLGWKGKRFGDAGVHEKQALVLVNYANASGKEIFELAQKIQKDVQKCFGITLETEVNIL